MATPNTELHPELIPAVTDAEQRAELEQARRLAERYRLEFVDMDTFRIDQDLFRSIPADLMLRYGFVPHRRIGKALEIVVSDPTDLPMIDELAVLLATPVKEAAGPQFAHQGDGGARHRREARAAGRPLQAADAGQDHRLPRLDHAQRPRRRLGHPYSRQGID